MPQVQFINVEYVFYHLYRLVIDFVIVIVNFSLGTNVFVVRVASGILTVVAIALLAVVLMKRRKLEQSEVEKFWKMFPAPKTEEEKKVEEKIMLPGWKKVLDHVDSDNEANWKLALIEADMMLEETLRDTGYDGLSVGDRLKTAEIKGGLKSLNEAWEAHKVRNKIAHESGFMLTKRDARAAVENYKKVFEELGYL